MDELDTIARPAAELVCAMWDAKLERVLSGDDSATRHLIVAVLRDLGFSRADIIGIGIPKNLVDTSHTWQVKNRITNAPFLGVIEQTKKEVSNAIQEARRAWSEAFDLRIAARANRVPTPSV